MYEELTEAKSLTFNWIYVGRDASASYNHVTWYRDGVLNNSSSL